MAFHSPALMAVRFRHHFFTAAFTDIYQQNIGAVTLDSWPSMKSSLKTTWKVLRNQYCTVQPRLQSQPSPVQTVRPEVTISVRMPVRYIVIILIQC